MRTTTSSTGWILLKDLIWHAAKYALRASECTSSFAGGLGFLCELGGYGDPAESEGIGGFCRRLRERCVRSYASVSTKKVFPDDGERLVEKCFRRCYDAAVLGKPSNGP